MARTLLVTGVKHTWREYLKTRREGRDVLVLDPADSHWGAPGRVALFRGEKLVDWRFVGCLDASKNPLAVLQGAAELLPLAQGDVLIQAPAFRRSPVLRQLLLGLAQWIQPEEILIPDGVDFGGEGWIVGPEPVLLEAEFPPMVVSAQRRARWLELLESCEDHEIPLDEVHFQGMRFGSGKRLPIDFFVRAGLEQVVWAESTQKTLVLISRKPLDDDQIASAMNIAHAAKVMLIDPICFSGHLCALSRQNGEHLGMGIIEEFDFVRGVARCRATAVAPAPVRTLQVGLLKLDSSGRELGEIRPWTI